MRRAVPVLAATGGVLGLLANFHTSPAPTGAVDTAAGSDASTSTEFLPTTAPSTTAVPTTRALPSTTVSLPATTTTVPPSVGTTIDGPVTSNEWGHVQVRITVSDGRVIDVQAITLPNSNSHSAALSRAVQRKLREEALQTQSADIDGVSGATLTSNNYRESLQGALDQIGR